ncbi:MAG: monovalent cation/H(+) antiporter subunit G [Oscillospiraceae bacterium]|nr:monovalent cation/H(+) antiporter subunit G [Oscillospiraceae bacterium]
MELTSNIIIIIGTVFMLFGAIGILKFRSFSLRVLIISKIDTVGAVTVVIGVALRHGISFFTLRVLLLLGILLVVNPMVTHIITRTAHVSGYNLEEDRGQDDT